MVDGLPQLRYSNISNQVYEILKDRIFSRQFAPGERLNLVEMERQLGISRTPLKDALNRLAAEGLVEIRPRSGTFVTVLSMDDIEELFDVRQVLEVYAAELAIQRIAESQLQQIRDIVRRMRELVSVEDWDEIYQEHIELDHQLHRVIVQSAGNKQLEKLWEQVNVYVQIARIRYRRSDRELDLSMKEHEGILQAFEAKDVATLQQMIKHHIERGKQSLRLDWEMLQGR